MSEKLDINKQHWDETIISNVATVIVGGTPSTNAPLFWGGNIPWMASGDIHLQHIYDVSGRITELGLKCSNAVIVEPKAIAMALAGQGKTRGTVAITHIPICTNQSVALIKTQTNKLDPDFLYQALVIRYEEMRSRSSGGGRGGLTKAIIEAVPILLPPLSQQRKIAKILTTVDNLIEKTEALIAKYQSIKQGMMHDLFTRGVDAKGKLRPPQSEGVSNWQKLRIGDFANTYAGGTPARGNHLFFGGNIPWVKSTEVNQGKIFNTEETITEIGLSSSSAKWIPANTVLVALYGATAAQIGFLKFKATSNQAVLAIIPTSQIDNYYLYYSLLSAKEKLLFLAQGSGQPNLNKQIVDNLKLDIPPLPQQRKIAEILLKQDQLIEDYEKELMKYKQLKTALMQDLLTGKVQVTPDEIDKGLAHA